MTIFQTSGLCVVCGRVALGLHVGFSLTKSIHLLPPPVLCWFGGTAASLTPCVSCFPKHITKGPFQRVLQLQSKWEMLAPGAGKLAKVTEHVHVDCAESYTLFWTQCNGFSFESGPKELPVLLAVNTPSVRRGQCAPTRP